MTICKSLQLNRLIHMYTVINSFAIVIVSGQLKRDYITAYQVALDLFEHQASLTNQEVILKLKQIREAVRYSVFDMVPINVPSEVEPALLINTFCLARLVEPSTSRCKQIDQKIIRGNIHRLNYIEIARLSKIIFSSENMQDLIDSYAKAQEFICQHGLVNDMRETLLKVEQLHRYQVGKFKRNLLAKLNHRESINELSSEDKIDAITKFIIKSYKVDPNDEQSIVAAYNKSFRQACQLLILDPFHTLMMTYETLNRQRVNMDRYRDTIWLYDLCSILPDKIDQIKSIGKVQNKINTIYMPAPRDFRPSLIENQSSS